MDGKPRTACLGAKPVPPFNDATSKKAVESFIFFKLESLSSKVNVAVQSYCEKDTRMKGWRRPKERARRSFWTLPFWLDRRALRKVMSFNNNGTLTSPIFNRVADVSRSGYPSTRTCCHANQPTFVDDQGGTIDDTKSEADRIVASATSSPTTHHWHHFK